MSLSADYYDGKSTKRSSVTLRLEGEAIRICGEGVERVAALHELRVSEPMGKAPRLVSFPDGAYCEIRDHEGLQALLRQTGFEDHFVVRWQFSLRGVLAAMVLCLGVFYAGYRWGLPWAAEIIAAEMPERVLKSVSDQVLESLDGQFLAPSKLPVARQESLSARFAALRTPTGIPLAHRVIFRANRAMPANAIALPSGTIILTDDLVALATRDNELMGVLAHELGHVHARHGMRLVVQGTVVGVVAAWFFGDISSIMAAAPAALLEARYSREFEREADAFAAQMLADNAISSRCLADLLLRLEKDHADARGKAGPVSNYLSTHPATAERLEGLQGRACE